MRRNTNLHDDMNSSGFFRNFILGGIIAIILNLLFGALTLIIFCAIVYFFLAAAGIVPPQNVVPMIPFI